MKYVLWAIAEIVIFRWLFWSVRKRIPREIAMSLGILLGVALCFQTFMHLLPLESALWGRSIWLKTISWGLLWMSAVLALLSMLTLRLKGKPFSGWEHTTQPIETGIYRLVRRPLYLAAILAVTGTALLRAALIILALWFPSMTCFFLAALYEDRYNVDKFGEAYRQYQAKSKLVIPFLF